MIGRKMKDSGIEWIGMIPENWELRKGKTLYDITTGKLDVNAEDTEGEYPFFTCSMHPKRISTYSFDCEALLVAGNGLVGFTQYYSGKFDAYQRTYVLSSFKECDPLFLKYYVSNNLSIEVEPKSNGSVISFIKLGDLQRFNISLPPIEEQHRIVEYLNRRCAQIDNAINATEKTIEEYKVLKQSIITEAVTHGIRGKREMKDSGIEWIGEIPEEWNTYRVASLYDERNENGNEEFPILTVSINSGISDHEVAKEEQIRAFIRSEDRTKYKRVYPGDLAYNMMRAWQGAFGAVRVDGMVSPAYVVAKPKKGIHLDNRYVEALLRTTIAIEEMHRYSKGITDFRLRLYWPEFKNIRVCLPSCEEQTEIADYIDRKTFKLNELISIKQQLLTELEVYKKSVIYEYVTGKKEVYPQVALLH